MKIIKHGSHCYDGTGWFTCPFWKLINTENQFESRCMLFGGSEGVKKNASESLVICNKVYGSHYEGAV
jgi:hypothetical protein